MRILERIARTPQHLWLTSRSTLAERREFEWQVRQSSFLKRDVRVAPGVVSIDLRRPAEKQIIEYWFGLRSWRIMPLPDAPSRLTIRLVREVMIHDEMPGDRVQTAALGLASVDRGLVWFGPGWIDDFRNDARFRVDGIDIELEDL